MVSQYYCAESNAQIQLVHTFNHVTVIVTGGVQVFFRFSQWHNLALHWLLTNVKREEALPQRRLDALKTTMKVSSTCDTQRLD